MVDSYSSGVRTPLSTLCPGVSGPKSRVKKGVKPVQGIGETQTLISSHFTSTMNGGIQETTFLF